MTLKYIKSISGASPDDGWCLECDICNSVVHESQSDGETCLDCIYKEAQALCADIARLYKEFDLEYEETLDEVDPPYCVDASFGFTYKGFRFSVCGSAMNVGGGDWEASELEADTLLYTG